MGDTADALAEVQLLIQDSTLDADEAIPVGDAEGRETKHLTIPADRQDRFLDGPACRRIAVVDFDPRTGAPLSPPARFVPNKSGRVTRGRYVYDGKPASRATIAVNAFGTVFSTVSMFEGPDALGRQVEWAFPGEQLLVVPRAGEWANAFYDRPTRSLQFFWFVAADGSTVHTALSRDIVAHECGHALLDAVVPSLFDSSTPQSIAIHEAVADLVAVLMALDSNRLRTAVLKRADNRLDGENAFNAIAEQFGRARPGPTGSTRRALRDLRNTATVTTLAAARPHELSVVLSGIFYDSLAAIYATRLDVELALQAQAGEPEDRDAAANKALAVAHIVGRRLLLRGIDYLPPGELSFADVGRASLAAERAARPPADSPERRKQQREFARRFRQRGVVGAAKQLDSPRPAALAVPPEQVPQLLESDWWAYAYVERNRAVIGIPSGTPFTVLPRIDATKVIGGRDASGDKPVQRELILKVAWDHVEKASVRGATRRLVRTGATVALRWADGSCLALVTSDVTGRSQRRERDRLTARLDEEGLLDGDVALHLDGGVATLRETHRLLHLAGWEA